MSELALLGGDPVRTRPFPAYRTIGDDEQAAVARILETGVLSKYLGTWHKDFYGGPEVQALEAEWAARYRVRHALAVNSCTSGLYAAVGAARCGPGDEVICSPYTMVASATAPLIYNAVPVFADIDPSTYNITADSIRARLSDRTRAIIVVHLFGQPADMDPIMALAAERDLVVIEDCAQAPLATYKGHPVGGLGHIGVFSLNYHKHIHTGEGGMVTTDDPDLADRVALIRNHAEAVVEKKGVEDLINMIGFNFRLGEIEAAIGRCQLAKADRLISERRDNVAYLEGRLAGLPGLRMPHVPDGIDHVHYVHALDYDEGVAGVPRAAVGAALRAELPVTELREDDGPLIGLGYVKPIYMLPMFQNMIGYGTVQCPFRCPHYDGAPDYRAGSCPNAETAHFQRLVTHELMRPPMTRADLDDVVRAFDKVFASLDRLRAVEESALA